MSALSGPERKQAMDAIAQAIEAYLKTQASDYEDSFYAPDAALIKGSKDWDLKGVRQAIVETKGGAEKKFDLSGKLVATGSGYESYRLDGAQFKWK